MEFIHNRKAFTFIELIMIIAVLGILVVVAIPKYQELSLQAKQNNMKGIIGEIRSAVAIQYGKNAADGNATFPDLTGAIFADGQVPNEVINNMNEVTITNENPIISFNDDGGYIYNKSTGEVRFDAKDYHTY